MMKVDISINLRVLVLTTFLYMPTWLMGQDKDSILLVLDSISNRQYYLKDITLQEIEVVGAIHPDKHVLHSYYKNDELTSTDRLLEQLPGLWMLRRGNYAAEPIVHGMKGGQVNVNIDGMKIYGACTDNMDPVTAYIEPDNLESVKFDKGGGLSEGVYPGGSLSLKLAPATLSMTPSLQGRVSTRYQQVSRGIDQSLLLNISRPKFGLRNSFTYRKHSNYKAGGKDIPFSAYEKLNFSVSGVRQLNPDAQLRFSMLGDVANDVGYPALPMDVAFARAFIYSTSYLKWYSGRKLENFEVKGYFNTINHLMDDTNREVYMHMDMPGRTYTAGAYSQWQWLPKGVHKLTMKLDGHYNFSHAEMTMFPKDEIPMYMLTWPDVNRWEGGGYFRDEMHLPDGNDLIIDGRLNGLSYHINNNIGIKQVEIFNFNNVDGRQSLLPAINVRWNHTLNPQLSFFVSSGYQQRAWHVSELYGYYLFNRQDGFDYMGNPDLNKEQSWQISQGGTFKNDVLNLNYSASLYSFTDYIMGVHAPDLQVMTYGGRGVKVYQNIARATLLGVDGMAIVKLHPKLHLLQSLTYSLGGDLNRNPLPQIPPFEGKMSVKWGDGLSWLQAEAEGALAQHRINESFLEVSTASYLIFNLRGQWTNKIKEKSVEISAGCENIFNKLYRTHLDWGNIPRPGRNIYGRISYKF